MKEIKLLLLMLLLVPVVVNADMVTPQDGRHTATVTNPDGAYTYYREYSKDKKGEVVKMVKVNDLYINNPKETIVRFEYKDKITISKQIIVQDDEYYCQSFEGYCVRGEDVRVSILTVGNMYTLGLWGLYAIVFGTPLLIVLCLIIFAIKKKNKKKEIKG